MSCEYKMAILVVAVNYGSYDESLAFLSSLRTIIKSGQLQCVLVDNSPEECASRNREKITLICEECFYIKPDKNLGYFGGALFGIEFYKNQHAADPSWIIVSNVDVLWRCDEVLAQLEAVKLKFPNVGCVAPNIVDAGGRGKNPYLAKRPSKTWMLWSLLIYSNVVFANAWVTLSLIKHKLLALFTEKSLEVKAFTEIYAAHGSVVIFDAQFALLHPDMFTKTFLYAEENIVAEYAVAHKKQIIYEPQINIFHQGAVSTGRWKSARITRYMFVATKTVWKCFYKASSKLNE